jgi:phosphopentomutase
VTGERRGVVIVLDGVGIGAAHDAHRYGDVGSDTLGHVLGATPESALPNLERLGLGGITALRGVRPPAAPLAAWGAMQPASAGKDSTTGHWELMGLHLDRPFPTYPNGFPPEVLDEFTRRTGRAVVGNVAASGTAIIERHAAEQARHGAWIVYTSADSVFQIAAHEEVIPLRELYAACAAARELLTAPHDVARVIARPFTGDPGSYRRTGHRRDFALEPPGETLLDALAAASIARSGIGKVDDLFAGRAITSRHTMNNEEGVALIEAWLRAGESGFLFVNLVDFDQQYGHRNDVAGFYRALVHFDAALPALLEALREDDLLAITADHGNDPTTPSTDHARERVPLLVTGKQLRPRDLGERSTFSDLGATVAEWFGIAFRGRGTSFLAEILA